MINWKIRLKNPVWWLQIGLAVLTPILAYAGLTVQDLSTWETVFKLLAGAVKNPYVLSLTVVSIWNAVNDPTTAGISDSTQAMGYEAPKEG